MSVVDLDLATKDQRENSSWAGGTTATRTFMAVDVLHDDELIVSSYTFLRTRGRISHMTAPFLMTYALVCSVRTGWEQRADPARRGEAAGNMQSAPSTRLIHVFTTACQLLLLTALRAGRGELQGQHAVTDAML